LTGGLSFWIVTGFLVLIVVRNIKRENKKGTSGLSSFILVILSLISLIVTLLYSIWLTPEKKDALVFVNLKNPQEKIICQFYLSGITESNPNWRFISTKNQTGLIRRIEIINDSTFSSEIELSEFPKNAPKVQVVEFQNKKYKLQSYMIMEDWNTWNTYSLKNNKR
jgi:hypothetical protein